MELQDRHPSTTGIARFFDYTHLPQYLQDVSVNFHDVAAFMIATLPDDPELTAGLRKLLEAKDCFVRLAASVLKE
jgi:ferritin-like protein